MTSPSNPAPGADQQTVPGSIAAGSDHAFCSACGAPLTVGARFCHRCGTPVGQGVPFTREAVSSAKSPLWPWALAFLALLVVMANYAGRNFGRSRSTGEEGTASAQPLAANDAPAGNAASDGAAPNIANMSPNERASRLYVRIMEYAQAGKADSVAFFAPMAIASHEMLTAPTIDERYHFGRIGEVTGNAAIVRAQADTILATTPRSLLGLMLASRAARMQKNAAEAKAFDQRLLQALSTELATGNQDYELHRAEIDRAVAEARRPN